MDANRWAKAEEGPVAHISLGEVQPFVDTGYLLGETQVLVSPTERMAGLTWWEHE